MECVSLVMERVRLMDLLNHANITSECLLNSFDYLTDTTEASSRLLFRVFPLTHKWPLKNETVYAASNLGRSSLKQMHTSYH